MKKMNKSLSIVLAFVLLCSIFSDYPLSVKADPMKEEPAASPQREKLSKQHNIPVEKIQKYLNMGYNLADLKAVLDETGSSTMEGDLAARKRVYLNNSQSIKSKVTSLLGPAYSQAVHAQSLNAASIPEKVHINTKPDQAPYTVQMDRETISTLGGNLSYTVTDLVLPGRNGLAFSLNRVYDSNASQFGKMSVKEGINAWDGASYEEKLFPIGKGWSWSISSIEQAQGEKFLHLAGGGTYKIENNRLKDYPWQDISFAPDTSVTVNGQVSAFAVKSVRGINQYFNSDGLLIKISDPYNNNILFKYRQDNLYGQVLYEIEDAISNKILIEYAKDLVTLTQGTRKVIYHKASVDGVELLSQVVDPLSRRETYDYQLAPAKLLW